MSENAPLAPSRSLLRARPDPPTLDPLNPLSLSLLAWICGRCADLLLRRFDALFAGLVAGGWAADPHGLRYAATGKMDRKARKMQRLVAATGHLCQELDVLAELEQGARLRRAQFAGTAEVTHRVARQRQEVDRLRAASLWNRSFDYAVRLLTRSLFTIVSRIIEVFGLEPKNADLAMDDDYSVVSARRCAALLLEQFLRREYQVTGVPLGFAR